MAELDDKVIVTKSKITDIADALREEMSESNEYSLPTMVEKVHELGQGQGSVYTAGVGIDITNRVVSVVDTLMIRGSASGSVASIVDGADDIPMKSCMVAIEPVQSGSGDPSSSNVRAISGWSECNLTVCGNNLLNPNAIIKGRIDNGVIGYQDGTSVLTPSETGVSFTTVANYRGVLTDLIKVKKGSKYYIKYTTADDTLLSKSLYIYDDNGNYIQTVSFSNLYTIPNTVGFIRVGFQLNFAGSVELTNMYIKEESSGDLFETYNGTTYNIEFPSEAGTVYGGTLDVTNGVLTVDRVKITLNGTQTITTKNWRANENGVGWIYAYSVTNNKLVASTDIPNILCDKLPTKKYNDLYNQNVGVGTYSTNELGLIVWQSDTSLTTDSAINTYLSSNPIDVVYEVATPTTYNLTPTEVKTLLGINNIFADCGDVDVEYTRDATSIINWLIAHINLGA